MLLQGTPENVALAGAVSKRIQADARVTGSKAFAIRMAGIAVLSTGIGTGIGTAVCLGFLGYSYLFDTRAVGEKLGESISKALANTLIRVDGSVRAEGTINMANDAVVGVKDGATVNLDPHAVVKLEQSGKSEVSMRLKDYINDQTFSDSGLKPITSLTIFKSNKFNGYAVDTGWVFSSFNDLSPSSQYCQITVNNNGPSRRIVSLGDNGVFTPPIGVDGVGVDFKEAFKSCFWAK